MADLAQGVGLPFKQAIDFFEKKARIPTSHWTDVWRTAHTKGFMVAGAASDALLADFQESISKALKDGTTLAEFRKDFDRIVEKHGWDYNGGRNWRSAIIYQTNLSMAYSAGRYEQLTEPETLIAFPYWQYVHTACQHPRMWHLAWDGLVLRADDPWWDSHYPPNGWRCGCRVRPVSHGDLRRMGKSGPDKAPLITTRPWRNPKTGEIHHVPVGIDPGFDYNVGKAWKEGQVALPAYARTTPAPPTEPKIPEVVPERVKPPAPPEPASYEAWVNRIMGSGRSDGTARIVGELPDDLGMPEGTPKPITLSSKQLIHLMREAKQLAGKAITAQEVRDIPAHLARPKAVLRQQSTGNLIFVFKRTDGAGVGKIVVGLDQTAKIARKKIPVTAVITAGVTKGWELSNKKEFEPLTGSVDDDEDDEGS